MLLSQLNILDNSLRTVASNTKLYDVFRSSYVTLASVNYGGGHQKGEQGSVNTAAVIVNVSRLLKQFCLSKWFSPRLVYTGSVIYSLAKRNSKDSNGYYRSFAVEIIVGRLEGICNSCLTARGHANEFK